MIAAITGILASGNQLTSLGTLAWHYDFNAPTATTNTDWKNTIKNVSGFDVVIRLFDFSGNGRHLIFPDATAPRLITNSVTGIGTVGLFSGAQVNTALSLTGVPCGTTIGRYKNNAAADVLNMLGGFSNITNSFAGYGNVSGGLTAETFTTGAGTGTFNYTKSAIPAGFNFLGWVWGSGFNMNLNGSMVHEPAGTNVQTDADFYLSIGKRKDIAQYFTGEIDVIAGFTNKFTATEYAKANTILAK